MKNTKKVLSVALAGALAFGSMGSAFAADAKLTEGIDNQDVVKAIEKLNAFGIVNGMEDGNYHAEGELTRAQFSKMLVEALGLGSAAQTSIHKPAFNDVDESCQWAWGYINVAQGQGLLSGYPDGTFKPSAKVSYAEALTMLVRALGYKDEFLSGSWPGNYMAKAADVDITDGVKVEGSVNRGAAALLLSNTLDANIIEQETYGDDDNWKVDEDTTLLENKLDIKKYEDTQVTAIPRVDGSVDKDQITFHYDDGSKDGDDETFDVVLDKVDIDNLLGEGLNVYYNTNDKEIVYVEKADKEFKTYYDVVDKDEDVKKDEFTIIKADKELNVDEDAVYYIDNKEADFEDFEKEAKKGDLFVKAVANEKGNIMVVDAQRFNQDKGVVAVSADAETLTYFDQSESEKDLKAKDYDKVVVMDNAGNMMKLEDIKANDIVYINDKDLDGDDLELAADKDEVLQLVVVREAVEGAGESWTDGEFEIANKDYDVSDKATVSVDENDDVVTYSSTSGHSKLDDITAEDAKVVALFDIAGDIRHISTDVKSSSSDLYGIITGVDERYSDVSVKILNPEGKEVEYELDTDELYGFTAESDLATNEEGLYDFVKYTLDKDGKIDTLVRLADIDKNLNITAITEPKDKDNNKSEVTADKGTGKGDIGKSSIRFVDGSSNEESYAVSDEVVVFDYTEGYTSAGTAIDDASDAEIVKWADLDDKTATGAEAVYAVDDKGIIQAILFTKNFDSIEDDVLAGYVVDVKTIDGDKYVDVVLEGSSEVERFEVEGTTPGSETAQMFKKTSSGKLKKVTSDDEYASITAKVVDVDGDDVTVKYLDGKSKTVVLDDAIFYETDDVKSYSDLDENDYVTLIVKNSEVKTVKLYDLDEANADDSETKKFIGLAGGSISDWAKVNEDSNTVTPDPEVKDGVVSYIGGTDNVIIVDGETYGFNSTTILYNASKDIVAVGSTDILGDGTDGALRKTDEVKDIVLEDGKVKSLVGKTLLVQDAAIADVKTQADADSLATAHLDKVAGLEYTAANLSTYETAIKAKATAEVDTLAELQAVITKANSDASDAAEVQAGKDVKSDISGLGGDYTNKAVADIRVAYNALTSAGKAEVDNLATLEAAEKALADAKTALADEITAAETVYNTEKSRVDSFTPAEIDSINNGGTADAFTTYNTAVGALKSAITTAKGIDVDKDTTKLSDMTGGKTTLDTAADTTFAGAKTTFDTNADVVATGK